MLKALTPRDDVSVSETEFRNALRQFASGVTVITTEDEHGGVHGMTATAFCSLSLRPPLVMAAVARGTRCHRLVLASRRFGVSILSSDQAHISRHYGGTPSPDTRPEFGRLNEVPVLKDAMVKLACELRDPVDGGDHSIFIGLVTGAITRPGAPLIHFEGRYHELAGDRAPA